MDSRNAQVTNLLLLQAMQVAPVLKVSWNGLVAFGAPMRSYGRFRFDMKSGCAYIGQPKSSWLHRFTEHYRTPDDVDGETEQKRNAR